MEESPDRLFDAYEQDLKNILQSVREKLDRKVPDERGEKRKASLRKVEMELDEADELVSQMEIEIQGLPRSIKPQYQARLRSVKTDITRCKKLSKDMHSQLARSDLLDGSAPSSDEPYGPTSDRTRLLAGVQILSNSSGRLLESQRIALETEQQGSDILVTLRGQRDQIENSRDMLRSADASVDRASGIIKNMIRRMYQQRVVMAGIITFFVLLIAVILWFKLVR